MTTNTPEVLAEVYDERVAQETKWGEQNHPDGTGLPEDRQHADMARHLCEVAFASGNGSWRHILAEEVCEAFAESDPARLREELVQVAAVAAAWVEAIDRRERRSLLRRLLRGVAR